MLRLYTVALDLLFFDSFSFPVAQIVVEALAGRQVSEGRPR